MKKLFHLMIAGVLVLSITGCGKSETFRTRNGLEEPVPEYSVIEPLVEPFSRTKTITVKKRAYVPPRDKNSSQLKRSNALAGNNLKRAKASAKRAVAKSKKPGLASSAKKMTMSLVKGGLSAGLTGIATNALSFIPPIPGMPPVLGKLLGFGGEEPDPDAAVLAAIAAIEEHLVKIDEKLEAISEQLTTVQSGVNDIIGYVNYIIKQNKCAYSDAKYTELNKLTLYIDASWKTLFGDGANTGLQRGIMTRMKLAFPEKDLSKIEQTTRDISGFAFTSAETSALNQVNLNLKSNNIAFALENLRLILFSSNEQQGLIYAGQNCKNRRFLSNSDSITNAAVVAGFQVLLEKVATLQAWSKTYGITPFPIDAFNQTLLTYSDISSKLAVLGSLRIPMGQVLDTSTNKMWAHGKDNVRLVDAMNGCVDLDVQNTAEVMQKTGPMVGWLVESNLSCVNNLAIDMPITKTTPPTITTPLIPGDEYKWRLPAIYEISQQAITPVVWMGEGEFPSAGDALFKDWSTGCGPTGLTKCANPGAYLKANGAEWLVDSEQVLTNVVGTGSSDPISENGLIWSSTSMAAAKDSQPQTFPRATASTIVQENDRSLTTFRAKSKTEWKDTTSIGRDRGLNKNHTVAIKTGDSKLGLAEHNKACTVLYGVDEKRLAGGTYREDCSNYKTSVFCNGDMVSSSAVPRGKFTYGDAPIPHTLASVRTANLNASDAQDEQVHAIAGYSEWGGSIDCTDAADWFPKLVESGNDLAAFAQLKSSISFPEYARTLYVRDLQPDEFYSFNETNGGYTEEVKLLREVTAPMINVVTIGSEFSVLAEGANAARCTLDPAQAPTTFDEIRVTSPNNPDPEHDCVVGGGPMSLKPGPHTIYAMAKSASGLNSGLVTESISFDGTAPLVPDFEVTAVKNAIVATLRGVRNPQYEYEATLLDGTSEKICKLITTTCTISTLQNNVPYGVTIKTSWGNQVSVSNQKMATPFGEPPAFTCVTVLAESKKVTLKCSSSSEDLLYQTPVDKYVVKNGSNVIVDCLPAIDCVINNLTNGVDTTLEVFAWNASGSRQQNKIVKSVGTPLTPTDVNVSGLEGKIYVTWNHESTGDAATQYVATATSGSVEYSCTSAQTMVAGIATAAPTGCVISVPATNSNLSYAVAVKGGNGNCSESSTTCNYSDSAPSTPSTIKPQFPPESPTLSATVENSKITVTATPGTKYLSTNRISIADASDPTRIFCEARAPLWKCDFEPITTTTFSETIQEKSYTLTAMGYNGNDVAGSPSQPRAVTVYKTPGLPVISQTITFDRKISVSIGLSTDVIDSYTVTATAPAGNFTCEISRPNQQCELIGLTNGTAYSVSATAKNNGGRSAPSALKDGLTPFGVPSAQIAPSVTLDTRGGSAVLHLSVKKPAYGVEITSYKVQMLNQEPSCTIVAPDTQCDIPIDVSYRGFGLQFTSTATNRIGESTSSLASEPIKYESAPLAPRNVILTTNFLDIAVKVLPDTNSSIATKFEVTASPGNYSDTCGSDGVCVLENAARGKVYTITMKAINASGTSPTSSRLYYLTAPPEAPQDLTASASSAGLVVELGARKIPADTSSMLVTATPSLGGATLSCRITLPAKTCAIESDPTKTYKISAAGEATSGEKPSASKSFKPTGVVRTIAAARQSPVRVTAGSQINKVIFLGKQATSKIKIDTVYSAFIKSLSLSAGKVSLLKFSGKVKSDSKKICKTKGSDVVLLKKGVCNISAKFKFVQNRKSTTIELSAQITVR